MIFKQPHYHAVTVEELSMPWFGRVQAEKNTRSHIKTHQKPHTSGWINLPGAAKCLSFGLLPQVLNNFVLSHSSQHVLCAI
jgi:hypothetical protein